MLATPNLSVNSKVACDTNTARSAASWRALPAEVRHIIDAGIRLRASNLVAKVAANKQLCKSFQRFFQRSNEARSVASCCALPNLDPVDRAAANEQFHSAQIKRFKSSKMLRQHAPSPAGALFEGLSKDLFKGLSKVKVQGLGLGFRFLSKRHL